MLCTHIFGTADDGLRLLYGSPAINAGINNSIPSGIITDVAGAARVQGGTVDIGAYESFNCLSYTTLYVNKNLPVSGNGSSWSTAFTELKDAIDIAQQCSNISTIWVAKGTYLPGSGSSFSMPNNVAIYGGFNGTETSLNARNWKTNVTLLKGNGSSVISNNGVTTAAVLDGFTITGAAQSGSGMYNYSSSPTINNCIFSGNSASSFGGGMYNVLSSPAITNSVFYLNTALCGGGICNTTSSPIITNCVFSSNSVSANGGAMCNFQSSSPVITNTTFSTNNAQTYGGGLFNSLSSPTITNSIIYGNNSGIYNYSSAPAVTYSLIQGGYSGTGNASADPLFINATDPNGADNIFGTADDGLKLKLGSPVVNSGSNAVVPSGITTDITGAARIQNSIVDMGAYEGVTCPLSAILYVDGSIATAGNGSSWASAFKELRDAVNVAGQCSNITAIYVAQGTYKPTNDANRNSAFAILRGGLKIYGGYPTGGGARNIAANPTILSGDIGTANLATDNSYHVIVIAGLTSAADSVIIDGFTVTGGYANGEAYANYGTTPVYQGNGASTYFLNNANGKKITLRNLIISNNAASYAAGGFQINNSSPIIANCTFNNNNAAYGGAVFMEAGASPLLVNCLFFSDRGGNGGGVFSEVTSSPVITNCTFYNNNCGGNGAAIFNNSLSLQLNNCIIWGNTSSNPGIYNNGNGVAVVQYSLVQGFSGGTGNLNTDPLFVNAADPDGTDNIFGTADDGLKLQPGSPALNAGNNVAIPSGTTTDITGAPRIQNATVDMGAYESAYSTSMARTSGEVFSAVTESNKAIINEEAAKQLMVTVLNNPVMGNEMILIVRGAQDDRLQVTLSDAQGKIISVKEMKQAGVTERISLSVSNSAATTLFVRVSTSKEMKTVKVMRIN